MQKSTLKKKIDFIFIRLFTNYNKDYESNNITHI